MIDREAVIKGLETCSDVYYGENGYCSNCPYYKINGNTCFAELVHDATVLLKEQEAEAKWIYGEDKTGVDGWYCSECNFFEPWFYEFTEDIDFIRFYGHCPKCGRRMTSYTGKPTQEGR